MKLHRRLLVLALAAVGSTGCDSDQGPEGTNWIAAGTHLAQITAFEIPDTVGALDTLTIVLSAELTMDRVEFSHIEVLWLGDTLQIGVWANADQWVGSGPMPPTSFTVLHEYDYDVPPPYPPSDFEVWFEERTSKRPADTVVVVDG
jgi:hypothetical protein